MKAQAWDPVQGHWPHARAGLAGPPPGVQKEKRTLIFHHKSGLGLGERGCECEAVLEQVGLRSLEPPATAPPRALQGFRSPLS